MGDPCMLCGGETNWSRDCKKCGLENIPTKKKKDHYEILFKGDKKHIVPLEGDLSVEEFLKKHKNNLKEILREADMNVIGYFKGKMCPFTQVKIGGTRAATLALTGASLSEFTWTHTECLEEYCAIWDAKNKCCSFMSNAKRGK